MKSNTELLKLVQAYKYDELEKALKENVREENQKKSGVKASTLSIVKRLMKVSEKGYNNSLKKQHVFQISGEQYFGITEGHYVLASKNDFGYETSEDFERVQMEKFFTDDRKNSLQVDVQEVRIFAKEHKGKAYKPYVIEWNGKYLGFDAQKLIDCLDFCNTDTIHFGDIKDHLKSPAHMEGDNELALLLPVCLVDPVKAMEYVKSWR